MNHEPCRTTTLPVPRILHAMRVNATQCRRKVDIISYLVFRISCFVLCALCFVLRNSYFVCTVVHVFMFHGTNNARQSSIIDSSIHGSIHESRIAHTDRLDSLVQHQHQYHHQHSTLVYLP